ncbi:MAG: helix-turn-helix domain-containing protein [Acidobacteriota bacterium]|nr:helix-turn-helix domain-containing protein [Acidobacteriota bacterium]
MGKRLTGEERRNAILRAAVPIFARKGFNGATTKEIAAAARVSEALLYKHFPGKETIYSELGTIAVRKHDIAQGVGAMQPCTQTLVSVVYFLVAMIYQGPPESDDDQDEITHDHMHRLMANSFLEDGAFARIFLQRNIKHWESFFQRCIEAAVDAGDMLEDWIHPRARWWFAHHIGVAIGYLNLPEEQVIHYGFPREQLLDQAVRFALRGMGLTDEAIARYYHIEELERFLAGVFDSLLNQPTS